MPVPLCELRQMSIADEFVERALSLPVAERAAIVHRLLASLEDEAAGTTDVDTVEGAWQAKLDERLAEADAGDFYPGTMDDLLTEIRQSIANRRQS